MDIEVKRKWVEALRSGKYAQSRNALIQSDCYCCLGVLAEINNEKYDTFTVGGEIVDEGFLINGEFESAFLPGGYCGLDMPVQEDLARMNDQGKSFKEIADYIEENM